MTTSVAEQTALGLLASSSEDAIIRRGWLQAMMARFDAPLGMIYNMAYDTGEDATRCTDVILEGSARWREQAPRLAGKTMSELDITLEQLAPTNHLGPCGQEQLRPTVFGGLPKEHQVRSALCTNIVQEGRFVGHLSLFRTADATEQFECAEVSGQDHHWERYTQELITATHSMLDHGPGQPCTVLFRANGELWMRAQRDAAALSEKLVESLAEHVRWFAQAQIKEAELYQHNSRIRLSMLEGEDEPAILVVSDPFQIPTVSKLSQLSPAQRLVSSYVARGMTVSEIAEAMSRGVGTVKSHIKNIYRSLNITTRAELASLHASALQWRP